MSLEAQALSFATRKHRAQRRKGRVKEPFVDHPIRVACRLQRHGLDEPVLIASAYLHDVLEDTDCSPAELEDTFGGEVVAIVQELTDNKHLLKSMRKQYQVERAPYLSLKARLIRLSDKIDNVGSLLEDPPDRWTVRRCRAYVAWARRVVDGIRGTHPGLEREFDQVADQAFRAFTGQPVHPPSLKEPT